VLLAVAGVFAALFVVGALPRLVVRHRLRADADAVANRLPIVSTVNPQRAPEVIEVPLPGSMEAILETGIWARTDGYLEARYVDIGDRVRKGQLLADIDTPEVDHQLMQAIATMSQDKANVVKAEADLALARTTLQRYLTAGPGTVSKQQIDERTSAVTDAEKAVDAVRATVDADEANVHRLLDLQSFQKVYAPFEGVITQRNVDPGSLISAGSTTGTRELFRLAQVDVLRIFVYVPQSYAPDIKVDEPADVTVRELPGRVFTGKVTRTAGAIDPTSRTLLTEVQVPNPDGLLLSGSYATVQFKIRRPDPPLVVPQSALLIDANGVRVALVDADGTLHYRPVQIGRDYGNDAEVLSGLSTTDVLATGLSPNVAEGSRVEVAKPAPPEAKP
jgi:RND family efflux transporter MFP subunit